jgi:hypothetical protein
MCNPRCQTLEAEGQILQAQVGPKVGSVRVDVQNLCRIFCTCGFHAHLNSETRPVVVLTGARQTGKTSAFLRLFPKHGFVSLNLRAKAGRAEK